MRPLIFSQVSLIAKKSPIPADSGPVPPRRTPLARPFRRADHRFGGDGQGCPRVSPKR